MNLEVKTKWLTNLRSGKYKQGKRQLKTKDNEFCCLAVLCDIYKKEHPEIIGWTEDGYFVIDKGNGTDQSKNYLPQTIQDWAGLDSHNPTISNQPADEQNKVFGSTTLGYMNDALDYDFEKIADIIEANL